MKKWDELPEFMKNEAVKHYYEMLQHKKVDLAAKRVFDFIVSVMLIIVLSPVLIILGLLVKISSEGPVFYRQVRITTYNKEFKIYKFRTMIVNADKIGTQVTTKADARITKVGRILRKYRLDELPQLLNVVKGEMTFVGTRPEVPRYVEAYTEEMRATLLLPAGITSIASIEYKDEEKLLDHADNADEVYISVVLPEKMKYNLKALQEFSFWKEIRTMFATVVAVIK